MDFAVSRDDGRTFAPPRRIADSAFPADLAVSPSGSLEVVYSQSVGGGSAIVHLRSTDAGASFEPPARIATAGTRRSVGGPMVAARPNGELMACWAETSPAAVRRDRLRCAERRAGSDWAEGKSLAVSLPANAAYALPALVGTARAWYLLLYLIESAWTEVAVFRSTGRVDFSKLETLATAPGLGLSQWCLTRECKLSRHDRFTPGDYAALAGSGGRLAAAYVLPRSGGPLFGSAAVHVSLLTEP